MSKSTHPGPMQNKSSSRYDVNIGHADTAMGRYLFEHELSFIQRTLSTTTQPYRMLEVGCGSGQITLALQDAGFPVMGMDIDLAALTICKHQSSTTPLVRGQAPDLPFADSSIDCVIAIECVGFFAHRPFLEESKRVLRDGGLLIFDSVNSRSYRLAMRQLAGRSVTRFLKRLLDRVAGIEQVRHIKTSAGDYQLSSREVLQATSECGFDILAVSGYNWIPFDVRSDSPLVRPAARVEQMLRLEHHYHLSPWFLVAARKV